MNFIHSLLAIVGSVLLTSTMSLAQGACPSSVPSGVNNCYFVAANGSDSNSGTSESTPWLHAPMMPNCSGACAVVQGATLKPGTGVILRGGDTWHFGNGAPGPNTGGTWNFDAPPYPMGNSTNPIYIGVDPNWYSGSSWVRPILTGDNPICNSGTLGNIGGGITCSTGTIPNTSYTQYYVSACAYQTNGGSDNIFDLGGLKYYIIDNLEITGICTQTTGGPGHHNDFISAGSLSGPITVQNIYAHGTSHVAFAGAQGSSLCTASNVCIDSIFFEGSTNAAGPGVSLFYNVADFQDSDPLGIMFGFNGGAYHAAYNVVRYQVNWLPADLRDVHDNLFEYFFEGGHSNLIESNSVHGASAVYNNVFRHIEQYLSSGGGVALWLGPTSTSDTVYFFNNVMYDVGSIEYFNMGGVGVTQDSGSYVLFNNTLQSNVNGAILNCSAIVTASADTNNHMIDNTNYKETFGTCNLLTSTTTQGMSNATATSMGYTSSQQFAYSPTASGSPTVGAGTNEYNGYCAALATAGIADAAAACRQDTTYGVSYDAVNHKAIWPVRTPVARPSSGNWDVGAYQFSGGGGTTTGLQPPTAIAIASH